MTDRENKALVAQATIELNEDAWAQSDLSLDRGDHSFSFDLTMYGDELVATFYENNSVQDEVGSLSCVVEKNADFCLDSIRDFDGLVAFDFSCRAL